MQPYPTELSAGRQCWSCPNHLSLQLHWFAWTGEHLFIEQRCSSAAEWRHSDFVCLEVCRLQDNTYTVVQSQNGRFERSFFCFYDFTSFRSFFHQRFIWNLINICFQLFCFYISKHFLDIGFCRKFYSWFVRAKQADYCITVCNQWFQQLVYVVQWYIGNNLS